MQTASAATHTGLEDPRTGHPATRRRLTRWLIAAVIAAVACSGQYLFFVVRNRVAPTPTGQIAGTWVGIVGQSRLNQLQNDLAPDGGSRYAVLLTFRTQLFGQQEYMTGHISVCSQKGVSTANFDDVWVLNDGVAPLQARNWTGKLKFDYPAIKLPGTATSVLPEDSADTEGYRLTAYTYGDPPFAEVSEDVAGPLHRGKAAEFERLCRSLRSDAHSGQATSAASPNR